MTATTWIENPCSSRMEPIPTADDDCTPNGYRLAYERVWEARTIGAEYAWVTPHVAFDAIRYVATFGRAGGTDWIIERNPPETGNPTGEVYRYRTTRQDWQDCPESCDGDGAPLVGLPVTEFYPLRADDHPDRYHRPISEDAAREIYQFGQDAPPF